MMEKDLRTHLRETAIWYGGLGLLTVRVARNLALPPSYFWIVAREIDRYDSVRIGEGTDLMAPVGSITRPAVHEHDGAVAGSRDVELDRDAVRRRHGAHHRT